MCEFRVYWDADASKKIILTCTEVNILWLKNNTTIDLHRGVYSSGEKSWNGFAQR